MVNSYKNIASFCKDFRVYKLRTTIADLSRVSGIKDRTLWAFENGTANNINHLSDYYDMCETETEKMEFLKGVAQWL